MRRVKRRSLLLQSTLQAEGMLKSALTRPTLFPRQLLCQGKAQRGPDFPLSQAILPLKKQANLPSSSPCSGFGRQWSSSSVIVSLQSSWLLLPVASCELLLISVSCFAVVSPVWKEFITMASLFCTKHVIQSQNTLLFLFCFPTCHCLSYSKAFLTAAFFVQVLSHIDFPSPKLWMKECGTKGKMVFFFFLQKEENCFVFMIPGRPTLLSCQNNIRKKKIFILNNSVWIKNIIWRDCLFEICISWENKKPLSVWVGMEKLLVFP